VEREIAEQEATGLEAIKSYGPELGTRGLHSEGGGGRGLTARMLSVLSSE